MKANFTLPTIYVGDCRNILFHLHGDLSESVICIVRGSFTSDGVFNEVDGATLEIGGCERKVLGIVPDGFCYVMMNVVGTIDKGDYLKVLVSRIIRDDKVKMECHVLAFSE